MKFILGRKLEMTQKFKDDGNVIPVTVVEAGPCFITQVKKQDKDNYKAIQIGFREAKKLNKALTGHLKGILKAKYITEFRLEDKDETEYKKGQKITVAVFDKGEKVKISGVSKGRGFQGVVKRHGFKGSKATHGNKDQLRHSGSVGAGGPAHVFKGTRMGGRMGGTRVSLANLEIIDIEPAKNLLYIKGALPGSRNSLVEIIAPGKIDFSKVEEKKEQKVQKEEKGKVKKEEGKEGLSTEKTVTVKEEQKVEDKKEKEQKGQEENEKIKTAVKE